MGSQKPKLPPGRQILKVLDELEKPPKRVSLFKELEKRGLVGCIEDAPEDLSVTYKERIKQAGYGKKAAA